MTLLIRSMDDALRAVCDELRIKPPRRLAPAGRYARTDTLESNGKGDAEVRIHDDGRGVEAVNWQTQQRKSVRVGGHSGDAPVVPQRDPERDRRDREEAEAIVAACARIVSGCAAEQHPYLVRKGFPEERGLVCADVWRHLPPGKLGEAVAKAIPASDEPLLVIPGRIAGRLVTVQFITTDGAKKNILKGRISGASHRIAMGRETWVCEGIATALSVRAALRLLGRSATVLAAFAAANVGKVASGIPGAIIAADHDKPMETLGWLGAGEYYASRSGCRWMQPVEIEDWNDMHQREGLRAVALRIKEAMPP